ncbi:MAG: hypothetical protein IT320_26030 [Anaerolineae bacterium]|nr:hypothetical protein [Anaerolineae bacterium]
MIRKWMAWSVALLASLGAVIGLWVRRENARRSASEEAAPPVDVPVPVAASTPQPAAPETPPATDDDLLPGWAQWLIIIAVILGCALLTFVLPAPFSSILLVLLLIGSVAGAVVLQRRPAREVRTAAIRLKRSPTMRVLTLLAEFALIAGVALAVNWTFIHSDSSERIFGYELEWLTSSAELAHVSLRDYGYLPLWQPYNNMGEPLIDNPFSFVLNPISAGPSLLMGGVQGVKISAVLYGLFAGFGGYFLARVLKLGLAGRLLLALLMIGKGNMLGMIGTGYYQLGVAQAYFPWVIGAALAVLRSRQARWAIVLLAVMFTLMFWAGNIWYMLPIGFSVVLMTLFHVIRWGKRRFDGAALWRMGLAALMTIGLSAVVLFPIFGHRDYIGSHPSEIDAGTVTDPVLIAQQFLTGDRVLFDAHIDPYLPQFYYTFVTPAWFLVLIFLLLPPIGIFRVFNRSGLSQSWRFWIPGTIVLVGTFIWGVGGNPIMIWLYKTVPLLPEWRFVGRALAVTSFWVAVLVALRVDSLWRLLFSSDFVFPTLPVRAVRAVRLNLGGLVLVLCGLAAFQVNQAASFFARTVPRDGQDTSCIRWLREQNPGQPLAIWRSGYDLTTPFQDYSVRQIGIEADFRALPIEPTIGQIDLLLQPSQYSFGWYGDDYVWLAENGYEAVVDGPRSQGVSCLYRYTRSLNYAFMISQFEMDAAFGATLNPELTTPITDFERLPDRVRLHVTADPDEAMVVTIQETAYPGWQVTLNGEPAELESVGGQVGVVLPAGASSYEVLFQYRPPLFYMGGAVTMATWAIAIGYLLRVERLPGMLRRRRREKQNTSPNA